MPGSHGDGNAVFIVKAKARPFHWVQPGLVCQAFPSPPLPVGRSRARPAKEAGDRLGPWSDPVRRTGRCAAWGGGPPSHRLEPTSNAGIMKITKDERERAWIVQATTPDNGLCLQSSHTNWEARLDAFAIGCASSSLPGHVAYIRPTSQGRL